MDDAVSASDALLRRGATGARRKAARKTNGAAAAPADAEDAHEQAPLLWRGEDDSGDEDDAGEAEEDGRAEGQAAGGAEDDDFDEWEGLPWYKKPSVGGIPYAFSALIYNAARS
jgi:hypothetical protein